MEFPKTRSTYGLAIALLVGTAGCSATNTNTTTAAAEGPSDADALRSALDDEYKAEATYEAVLERFGEVRPFVNIIEAERRHAAMAKAEMDRLGIDYDRTNPYAGKIEAPASILAACEDGIEAEVENIELYDRILPSVSDPHVREVLGRLQAASRDKHLPAFRRCVERGGSMGRGRG